MPFNKVYVRNSQTLTIQYIGSTKFHSKFNPTYKLILSNILHVPSILKNMLSLLKFNSDNKVIFEILPDTFYIISPAYKQVTI